MTNASLRALPSVDALVRAVEPRMHDALPHHELVVAVRNVLAATRQAITNGAAAPTPDNLVAAVLEHIAQHLQPHLRPLINASGVILQTNLGRAPLSDAALHAMQTVAHGYSNLEYDLHAGERGSRYDHLDAQLARLTGAEAALAVNNNAAAVVLVLACFCAGKQVLVSRGQAVEIGGGFRIPDVLQQSGARLVEVGTTNRTYARDYAEAVTPDTAALLTVHRSNFRMVGFTHDPADHELQQVAADAGMLWIDDWGSGSLIQPAHYGLAHEPTIGDRVAAGCDIMCFSGDKLLGGPQAGLIIGKQEHIARIRKHPLLRALRVDKLTIAALEATLGSYVRGRAADELPVWQMIGAPLDHLRARAEAIAQHVRASGNAADVVACESAVGGGSLPGETLPSWAVALGRSPNALHAQLRMGTPAVVGRIANDRLLLDMRTVLPHQDDALCAALVAQLGSGK